MFLLNFLINVNKFYFFRNGKCMGDAFTDIYGGTYYPAVSLYKNITVSINFGPKFKHPPKDYDWKPVSF